MTSPREAWIEARLCTRSARRLVTCKMWIVVLPRAPPQTALRLPGGQDAPHSVTRQVSFVGRFLASPKAALNLRALVLSMSFYSDASAAEALRTLKAQS